MATAKARPTGNSDGTTIVTPSRTGKYGEAYALLMGPQRYGLADEGSYFTATNATTGTQITAHAAPAISDTDTKSIIHLFNSGTLDIYLDYIHLATTVANASATQLYFNAYLDNKGTTCRSSGGTSITNINNVRNNSTTTSGAAIYAGAVVTAPLTSRKVMAREVRPSIGIALDQYNFSFGHGLINTSYSQVATVAAIYTAGPPIIIGPGGNLMFVQCSPSGATTAMTFEFEMAWWER